MGFQASNNHCSIRSKACLPQWRQGRIVRQGISSGHQAELLPRALGTHHIASQCIVVHHSGHCSGHFLTECLVRGLVEEDLVKGWGSPQRFPCFPSVSHIIFHQFISKSTRILPLDVQLPSTPSEHVAVFSVPAGTVSPSFLSQLCCLLV